MVSFDLILAKLLLLLILLVLLTKDLFTLSFLASLVMVANTLPAVLPESQKQLGKDNFITVNKKILTKLCAAILGLPFLLYSFNIMILLFILAPLCNALPMTFNRGLMPCLPRAYIKHFGRLQKTDSEGQIKDPVNKGYCYTDSKTKLAFLGDNFYFKRFNGVVSVGDLLLLTASTIGVIYQVIQIFS